MRQDIGFDQLSSLVIERGLCTTCGTCVGVCAKNALAFFERNGELIPQLIGNCNNCGLCYEVCPGERIPLLEMEKRLFGKERERVQPDLGVYRSLGYGCANSSIIRQAGSSGGIVTAVLIYALEQGLIDAAVIAGFNAMRPWQTASMVATSASEILQGSQSKYAPVPVNERLSEAAKGGRKVAVVGLPCQIHALKKIQLARRPASIANSLKFTIGLCCAAEFYWEGTRHILQEWGGISKIENLTSLEYRGDAWPGHLVATTDEGQRVVVDRHQYMYHMLLPGYKRDRCEMCIDWSAELADISCGDYWPSKSDGEGGYTFIIVRSETGEELILKCTAAGELKITSISDNEKATISGSMGYELKKHAAAYRLRQRQSFGWPVPNYDYLPEGAPYNRPFHFAPQRK